MRGEALASHFLLEIPLIPNTQIALVGWREGKVGTFYNVICRHEHFGDLGVEQRERTCNGQAVNRGRRPGEVAFKALDLGIGCVVREEQVHDRRIEDCGLQTFNVDEEG